MRTPFACGALPIILTLTLTLTQVIGCMRNPYACGEARASVTLIDEPLQAAIAGAYRRVGRTTAFTLCACATTYDPDSDTACAAM